MTRIEFDFVERAKIGVIQRIIKQLTLLAQFIVREHRYDFAEIGFARQPNFNHGNSSFSKAGMFGRQCIVREAYDVNCADSRLYMLILGIRLRSVYARLSFPFCIVVCFDQVVSSAVMEKQLDDDSVLSGMQADLVQAYRHYLTTPGSSAVAIFVLASAMAVLTAFLALFSDLSLSRHPGFASRDLVTITQTDGNRLLYASYGLIERIDEEATSIDAIAGSLTTALAFDRDGERQPVAAELVTRRYFPELRPRLQFGRPFDARDHALGAEPVVIISDYFWRQLFAASPDALGKSVHIFGPNITIARDGSISNPVDFVQAHQIVGVMAPEMTGTTNSGVNLWTPFEPAAEYLFPEIGGLAAIRDGSISMTAVARPAPGASVDTIRFELQSRYGAATELGVGRRPNERLEAVRGIVRDLNDHREAIKQVRLFLGGSALLALVAASNISLFLLSRAPGRQRELAIRLAVGAPLKRIARQLVTETGLLVVVATLLGLMLSLWVTALAIELTFVEQATQGRSVSPLDWRILATVTGCSLLVTGLVSLAPLVALRRLSIGARSRNVSARASFAQRLAGAIQLSIASVVTAAAFAFIWYFVEVSAVDPGFSAPDTQVIALFSETPVQPDSNVDALLLEQSHRREVMESLPGVDEVAFGTSIPGQFRQMWSMTIAPPGDPENSFRLMMQAADAKFLPMLGVNLLQGRLLEADDREAVVINETLARRLWSRIDIVGELLPLPFQRYEVVGVIGDIAYGHPAEDAEPIVYHVASPLVGSDWALVKTRRSISEIREAVLQKIQENELDARLGVVRSVELDWRASLAPDRTRTWLTITCALVVAALAGFGFYGTQSFLVAAGRREYAILAAVGAGPRALGLLVLKRSLRLGAPGIVLGSVLAFIAVAWLQGDFVSNSVSATAVAAIVVAMMSALVLIASIGPMRRTRQTQIGGLLNQD